MRSWRTVQHTQPLSITTMSSSASEPARVAMSASSMPIAPNSFSITAMRLPWSAVRMRLISVVLPEPYKTASVTYGNTQEATVSVEGETHHRSSFVGKPSPEHTRCFWEAWRACCTQRHFLAPIDTLGRVPACKRRAHRAPGATSAPHVRRPQCFQRRVAAAPRGAAAASGAVYDAPGSL